MWVPELNLDPHEFLASTLPTEPFLWVLYNIRDLFLTSLEAEKAKVWHIWSLRVSSCCRVIPLQRRRMEGRISLEKGSLFAHITSSVLKVPHG